MNTASNQQSTMIAPSQQMTQQEFQKAVIKGLLGVALSSIIISIFIAIIACVSANKIISRIQFNELTQEEQMLLLSHNQYNQTLCPLIPIMYPVF